MRTMRARLQLPSRHQVGSDNPSVHAAKVMKAMAHWFEKDSRTENQRAADLNDPLVTISMYAVDDHGETRKRSSVFKAEATDWEPVVSGTYRQFIAETGFDNPGMPSYQEAGDVWLVADTWTPGAGVVRVAGAAEVRRKGDHGELMWVWMHPLRRGSKKELTQRLVNRLGEEYGTIVSSPERNTPAGERFLEFHFPIFEGDPPIGDEWQTRVKG